jgi:hypothetical protein
MPISIGVVTSYSVLGLIAKDAYYFTIQAIGAGGTGLAGISSIVYPTAPSTPAYSPTPTYPQFPFKYVITGLETGEVLGTLPFYGVSFSKVLNGGGQFTGQLDLADPNTMYTDLINKTISGKCDIHVDFNGSLIASYVVIQRGYDREAGKMALTIQGADIWNYFAQRIQATDYSSPPYSGITGPSTPMSIWDASYISVGSAQTGWDPALMAWQIVSDALSVESPYSNLLGGLSIAANGYTVVGSDSTANSYLYNISADQTGPAFTGTPTTSYVAQTFPFSSLQTVDTMVNQLTQLGYQVGFDRGLDVAYSNGPLSTPVGTVNFSYPRRGRTYSQNNLVCDLRPARSYQFPEDASQMANTIYETGTAGCIVGIQNIYPLEQGWPIFEKTVSRSQINSANISQLLYAIGLSDLYLDSYPVVVPQIVVNAFGTSPTLGQFIEGDDILLRLPATDPVTGLVIDPRFPGGMYQEWRVQQWSVSVGDYGDSTLTLTLNIPPAPTALNPSI